MLMFCLCEKNTEGVELLYGANYIWLVRYFRSQI